MDDSKALKLFQPEEEPKIDPAYFQKLNEEMMVLAEKIPVVAREPYEGEIWCKIGDVWYGHPVTPLLLRYRALMWLYANPPDPRGEKCYSRVGPYTVYVRKEDMVEILGYSDRTIDRMLKLVRDATYKKPYERITVEQFCFLNELPEDKIQQQLDELFKKRWKKHK